MTQDQVSVLQEAKDFGKRQNVLMETIITEPLLDAKEVKRLLKCSLPLVYKLAQRGQIPCVRIPCPKYGEKRAKTIVRFKKDDVLMLIEKHYKF